MCCIIILYFVVGCPAVAVQGIEMCIYCSVDVSCLNDNVLYGGSFWSKQLNLETLFEEGRT